MFPSIFVFGKSSRKGRDKVPRRTTVDAPQALLASLATRYRTEIATMTISPALPLRIALVGMSGAGKSFWTKRLSASGRPSVCCDDQIEVRLKPRRMAGGYAGINGVAAWMGWPDSPTYAERE